ncbi:GIY-YIG nuclease family protein [Companilactobacillus sp.]|jgi:hypothetical protein|uniref:GIY-YIG nuclease family protein n=1 Tax=Companilactobacillus sp. TaxID=2767905 RepID=UPI0025B9C5BB|nr:GIY-YIG nuclease family protein [Companilactobacillus sp.]MCH4008666.1 GIY-YIG nuclease family protein [Companilactobacillus sp.]MCH4051155.1 GIY-YIG nuclease family protein [Companilactobacillus sp.]MCH4076609.1 GIY-YIG nuclease family protein [Companilactobacillus sp.]MCH4125184.1 GIY-YIG nuclease family protein [Companilactobacillus sp.]MCH4131724.1 GIY-YIG nuclease family protein [Companilactobacillus sp.]
MDSDKDFGYVYVCENKSFPGKYKIGQTRNLKNRMHQFNNTGFPDGNPTLLDFAVYLKNYKRAERLLHKALSEKRESTDKEFFLCTFNQVKYIFELLKFNDEDARLVHPEEINSFITGKEIKHIKRKIGTRPNRTFKYLNIQPGTKLSYKEDPKMQVTVLDGKNQVLCCCGKQHSLSRAAICCYDNFHDLPEEKRGRDRNGFAFFTYQGILLSKRKPMVHAELD